MGWECEQLWYRNEVTIARYSSIKEEKKLKKFNVRIWFQKKKY